jgi:hypothetical protein
VKKSDKNPKRHGHKNKNESQAINREEKKIRTGIIKPFATQQITGL